MTKKSFVLDRVTGSDILNMLDLVPPTFENQTRAIIPGLKISDLNNLLQAQKELQSINPRHFEVLVAELLKADGYEAIKIIKRVNAPGPDIVAFCNGPSGQQECYVIECKKWKDVVGVDVIRNLMYRVDTEFRASGAMIVTSSRFTRDAIDETQKFHKWRLTLRDGDDVINWIKDKAIEKKLLVNSELRYHRLIKVHSGKELFSFLTAQVYDHRFHFSDQKCSACNGSILCGGAYIGPSDKGEYVFSFFHICEQCLSFEISELESAVFVRNCPFCGSEYDFNSHARYSGAIIKMKNNVAFIGRDGGDRFCTLLEENDQNIWKHLKAGDRVTFKLTFNIRGLVASDIKKEN